MKNLMLIGLLGGCLLAVPAAQAAPVSVSVGIGIGPAVVAGPPVCEYGYYPDYPYACAPVGYYGPDWFSGGVFIGAGPWFHGYYGRPGFRGPVGPAFRGGPVAHGPVFNGRAPVGRDFHAAPAPRGAARGFRR